MWHRGGMQALKITREVNGEKMEFELTVYELHQAYIEQEHLYDIDDVEIYFEDIEDEDLKMEYGLSRNGLAVKIQDIAYEMRRNMDKYGIGMEQARVNAIEWVLKDRRWGN